MRMHVLCGMGNSAHVLILTTPIFRSVNLDTLKSGPAKAGVAGVPTPPLDDLSANFHRIPIKGIESNHY